MSFGRYAMHADELAQELIHSISTEEIETLRRSLTGVPLRDWWRWRDKHAEQIAAFVAATPSQRVRKKIWKQVRLQLTLAAIQHCLEAAALLQSVDQLYPEYSYRQMTSLAGRIYQEIFYAHIPDWPFDGESPFSE